MPNYIVFSIYITQLLQALESKYMENIFNLHLITILHVQVIRFFSPYFTNFYQHLIGIT